ncbi:hypothetical protein LC612_29510 [Nostoc sp. CHAB 5834]|nr:hypothetical protein [Nostoc sp. CHAB 5834]
MNHNPKFALIDKAGDSRFAAIIDGTYQIGKDRRRKPTSIEDFARAVLIDGEDGRFVCADGRKPALLKYISTRNVEAVAYRIDPIIAAKLGIDAYGRK